MNHARITDVFRRAVRAAQAPDFPLLDESGAIPVDHYTDPDRLLRERSRLFRGLPIPIAHVGEVGRHDQKDKNNVVVRELDGVSILLTRDHDGALRGFRNSCRHRGVRLTREDCRAKAFVCPYHGWTYGMDGALMHIPHARSFPMFQDCASANKNLVPVRVEERHGLIWAMLDEKAPDVATHLAAIDDELATLGFENHFVGQRVVSEQRGNWKMLVEAFLDIYHVRHLHRNSVYPFFLDARSIAEREGAHVRAASARRPAKEIDVDCVGRSDQPIAIRDIATLSYVIFPSTTLIFHPDWTSLIVVQPIATDRFVWSHTQLIVDEPKTEKAKEHFARSFTLIEGSVFQKEDLLMCEEMQAGIETGANDALTFGQLESPAIWLHEEIARVLDRGQVP